MAINAIYPVSIGTCVIQIRLTSWVHPKWFPGDKGTRVSTSDHYAAERSAEAVSSSRG